MMENQGLGLEAVQVLTAGGAAKIGKKKKRKPKRRTHKKSESQSLTTNTANGTSAISETTNTSSPESPTTTSGAPATDDVVVDLQNPAPASSPLALELEESQSALDEDLLLEEAKSLMSSNHGDTSILDPPVEPVKLDTMIEDFGANSNTSELVWLFLCFMGIMASFVVYGILLEYTTSGGRKLHELSFLFVTSSLYTVTAAAGRYVRAETPTTIPPARFAVLGLTSMGSTFCSVRSLR